jgi:vesicle coat complex subunit
VANAVAALSEIDETAKEDVFSLNTENLKMLLAALNECTEYALFLSFAWEPAKINGRSEPSQTLTARTQHRWGQVFILHALSKYTPDDSREAEAIAERVTPRLAHANSAVVLSTIRVRLLPPPPPHFVGMTLSVSCRALSR